MGIYPRQTLDQSPSSSPPDSPPLTASTSITDAVIGSHEFKIAGYSLAKGLGKGKYIESAKFTVAGHAWAIYFYPDGKNPDDNAEFVSMFIALASEGGDVRALFELTLVDQSGNEQHKVCSHFDRPLAAGPYTLKCNGSMWGYKRYIQRADLEKSDYLKDDCLLVQCRVGVVRSHTVGHNVYSPAVPPPDFGQHFGEPLVSGMGTDVAYEVDKEFTEQCSIK